VIRHPANGKQDAHEATANRSELVVPIVADRHVYGLIYAWGFEKYFFNKQHLAILSEVAEASAVRLSKYYTEERLRSKIAQDLHDDLGSVLSSININSKMALESAIHPDVKTYLQKIRQNSGNMMESMSDIVWAIDPQNDTLEKVVLRMKEFAADILEPLNIAYRFVEEGDTESVELDLTKRKNVYLIFKESINNAAKYSGCTQITVHIRHSGDQVWLQVKDNGTGFDAATVKRGNGLRNMEERASDMGAVIEVGSVAGCGTTVELKVPIT
jgi:signal transduction histidine kinase